MKQFKAGHYINQGYYKSFQPALINRQWQVESMEVIQLLSQADRELGRLDMYSKYIPNIDLFMTVTFILTIAYILYPQNRKLKTGNGKLPQNKNL